MLNGRAPSEAAKVPVLLSIFALAALGIHSTIGLYADGSYGLFQILTRKGFWILERPRAFVELMTQSPPVLAIQTGENSLNKLVVLHSLGLVGIPLLLWMCALAIHLRTTFFWVLLAAFSVTYLTCGLVAVGEFNLAYALAAVCCAILVKDGFSRWRALALVLAAFALTCSYEATVFLGPVLFAISIRRALECRDAARSLERLSLVTASFLFAAASTIAVWSIIHPRDPGNLASALSIAAVVKSTHFMFVASMVSICIAQHAPLKSIHKGTLTAIALIASVLYLANPGSWNAPSMNYAFRTISGLLLLVIFVFALFRHSFRNWGSPAESQPSETPDHLAIASTALFIALAVPFAINTAKFATWAKAFEGAAIEASSWIPIETVLPYTGGASRHYDGGFNWAWTNPSMSLILRGNHHGGLLNNSSYKGWQPFQPTEMTSNPLDSYRK